MLRIMAATRPKVKTAYEHVKEWRARPENSGKRTEEARRYRQKHRDEVNARRLKWKRANIEKVRAQDAKNHRCRYADDPEGNRRRYQAHLARLLAKREVACGRKRPARCEICGELPYKGRPTVWDHCHRTGVFRGWICDRCNKVLGLVKDSPELLSALMAYLSPTRRTIASDG